MEKKKKYLIGAKHCTLYEVVGAGVSALVHRALYTPLREVVTVKILDFERGNCDMVFPILYVCMCSIEEKETQPNQFDLSTYSQSPTRSLAISTVSNSQTLIYIGTLARTLILLQSSPKTTSFLQTITVTNGSPIDRIIILPKIVKLLVLSNGSLFLLDSLLSQPAKRLAFFKGVSAITRRFHSTGNLTESTDFINNTASSPPSSSSSEYASASQQLLQRLSGGIRSNGLKIKESEQQQQQQQWSEANNIGLF